MRVMGMVHQIERRGGPIAGPMAAGWPGVTTRPASGGDPPPRGAWQALARIGDPRLDEVSGVAASRSHPGMLWVHNDSGDSARLFAVDRGGRTRAELVVDGAMALDWEDLAIGPGPAGSGDGRPWVHVADVGDNLRLRPVVSIYRFPEPDPTRGDQRVHAQRIDVTYPGLRRHDVEALLVDPRSGDLVLVTKEADGEASVFVVDAARARPGSPVEAREVGRLPAGRRITAGDVSPDGGSIVLRSYREAWAWDRRDGETIAAALEREPRRFDAPDDSESIAFTADGRALVSIPEGREPTISWIAAP